MNHSIKQKWANALRNEAYTPSPKHGTHVLRNHKNEWNIWGVLCDISECGTWENFEPMPQYQKFSLNDGSEVSVFILPETLRLKYNLDEQIHIGQLQDMMKSGLGFWDAAEWIEENIPSE